MKIHVHVYTVHVRLHSKETLIKIATRTCIGGSSGDTISTISVKMHCST